MVCLSGVYYEGFVTLPIKSTEPVNENNVTQFGATFSKCSTV